MNTITLRAFSDELQKIAETGPASNPDVQRAALKGVAVTAAGTALGYGLGKVVGSGLDYLEKTKNISIPRQYLAPTAALLGLGLMAAREARDSKFLEVVRHAQHDSENRRSR